MSTDPGTLQARRTGEQSPVIWRCRCCGALVHPAGEGTPVASCARCGRMTEVRRDGR